MRSLLPALIVLAPLVLFPTPTPASDATSAVDDCDRLSAHPFDPNKSPSSAGVPIEDLDAARAITACKLALEQQSGDPRLQFQLARSLFTDGRSSDAMEYLRKAAAQGYPAAERNMGYLYYRGRILPQDDDAALVWFRRAADKGHGLAQHDLGKMYERGHGAPRDLVQAAAWYRKSAEGLFTRGQHALAYSYQTGSGVPKDRIEALKWFRIASLLGDEYAGFVGRLAAIHMKPDDIAKAERLAEDWLASRAD